MTKLPIKPEHVDYPQLGEIAHVAAENANCLYEPKPGSAIRCTPPIGTEVAVIRDEGAWVCILVFDKKAWTPRGNLSSTRGPVQETVIVGVHPSFIAGPVLSNRVEYGPRGGRFVRSCSGFKRYI